MAYVEDTLISDEVIVKKAERNGICLLGVWIVGILFCWLLLIPLIKAIIETVEFNSVELAVTNKRIRGKVGVVDTKALDAPIDKLQNVSVYQTFWGRIFNHSIIQINTTAGVWRFKYIKDGEDFKAILMSQYETYQEDKIKIQATEIARTMIDAMKAEKSI